LLAESQWTQEILHGGTAANCYGYRKYSDGSLRFGSVIQGVARAKLP
jgi:hypothetical protein